MALLVDLGRAPSSAARAPLGWASRPVRAALRGEGLAHRADRDLLSAAQDFSDKSIHLFFDHVSQLWSEMKTRRKFGGERLPQVFGLGSHIDAVRSTKAFRVFAFGHVWVTLAVVVTVPFSKRAWALPVLFRLYRNKKESIAKGDPYKKKTELAREMLEVFATWTERPVFVCMDSAYCNDTVLRGLLERIKVVAP